MKAFFVIAICSLLVACGFHLRGNADIPPPIQRMFVRSTASYSLFAQNFQALLQRSGARLVDEPQHADLVVILDSEQVNKTFESVGTNVQLHQYNLQYSVHYQLKNRQQILIMPRQQVASSRVYRENANQQLGSTEEETVLIAEMQQEVMRNLLARLTSRDTLEALHLTRSHENEDKHRPAR